MLAADHIPSDNDKDKPCLVWLHGLLGSRHDWDTCRQNLHQWNHLTIDLPGHGDSINCPVTGFDSLCQQLTKLLKHYAINRYILIGYSLGGRIAMYYSCFAAAKGLAGLVIEGGNPGLISPELRQQRLLHDQGWATCFRRDAMEHVLTKWYQQPVFADLSEQEKLSLIEQRCENSGQAIAEMLEVVSLGRQPSLAKQLMKYVAVNHLPFCYLCGEYDLKFQQIAKENHFPLRTISAAGHNAHRANPVEYAQQLISFLKEY